MFSPKFPMNINPVHPGVYGVKTQPGFEHNEYAKWTGEYWTVCARCVEDLRFEMEMGTYCYDGKVVAWFGLDKEQK